MKSHLPHLGALGAGLLLAASDHPLHWWPLQFVAFVPFWWAVATRAANQRETWSLGAVFGAAYGAALLPSVGLALPILVAAAAALLQWTVAAGLAGRRLVTMTLRSTLAAAATVTLVEMVVWRIVPMFGTAQCFTRPLSAAPQLVAFVAFTGIGGLVFAVTALQALLVAALRGPARLTTLAGAGAIAAAVGWLDYVRWHQPAGERVLVATYGWHKYPELPADRLFIDDACAEAQAANAQLLVTPETGIMVQDRARAAAHFGQLCAQHQLQAAIGVFVKESNDNRVWNFTPRGIPVGEYRKTHLVPWLESYTAGDGQLLAAPFGSERLGNLICQDDNFTDLARGYGRNGIPIVAIPTNDWPAIREFHLENTVFRAIENGFAIVRAASGGISALITPRGEVVHRCDHVVEGAKLLVGELEIGNGDTTVYARWGDVPILVIVFALAVRGLLTGQRRRQG